MPSSGSNQVFIEVDGYKQDRRSCFFPGQKVTGKVIYVIQKDQDKLTDVSIEFYGKMETYVWVSNGNNRHKYKEHIGLFSYRSDLYRGDYTMKAQTMSWPFEFRFPDMISYPRKDENVPGYAPSGAMELPPSFEHTTNSFRHNGACFIRYKLKARVNNDRMFHNSKTDLHLVVRRRLPTPAQQRCEMKPFPLASWSSRSLRENQHTFSQKMKHVFTSDESLRTPSISFNASIQLPVVTGVSQQRDLVLTLNQVRQGPTDPEKPVLVLGKAAITLQGLTELRVERPIWSGSYYDDGKDVECSGTWHQKEDSMRTLPLDGTPYVLSKNWALPDLPQSMAILPDFATWTISHGHRFKVEVEVIHPASGHVFKLEGKWPVLVHADAITLPEELPLQPPVQATLGDDEDDEPPPVYSAGPSGGPSTAPPPSYDMKNAT